MATGFPDFTRAIVLLGWDGENFIPVLLDDEGNLNALMVGKDALDVLHVVAVDGSGQIIMVPRGDSGFYLDVDSEGYMTTVIKGWDGAALATVKVDDAGRLSAFVIDSVDAWNRMLTVGNAELAARLGSPSRYEQQGRVQLIESFETGLSRWLAYPGQADASAVLDPTKFATGGYSVKMTTCTADPWNMMLQHQEGVLGSKRYGLEISFAIGTQIDRLTAHLSIYDGTKIHNGAWRYHHNDKKMYVRTGAVAWAEVDDVLERSVDGQIFSRMKHVIDVNTGKYVRAYLDNLEYPVTTHGLYIRTEANVPRVVVGIYLNGDDGANQVMWLDDVIVTSAEPE